MTRRLGGFLAGLLLLLLAGSVSAGQQDAELRLGEQMYRQGLLPSGEPMPGTVQGDIPIDGSMFSCESCHLRSGLGSNEGRIITMPTNAAKLYRPLYRGSEVETNWPRERISPPLRGNLVRPAYTDETLARAIWSGIGAGGRRLDPTMPQYDLTPEQMRILVNYLKTLSRDFSPGVSPTTITLATVVTEGVDAGERQVMLQTLEAFIRDRNSLSRNNVNRARYGPFFHQEMDVSFRKLELLVWELKGAPETWPAQLQEHYRRQPVFALVGGLAAGSWEPIQRFCEVQRLPAIFPFTRQPYLPQDNWYTSYISRGPYHEGTSAARYLSNPDNPYHRQQVVMIYGDGAAETDLARGFREQWKALSRQPLIEYRLTEGGEEEVQRLRQLVGEHAGENLLLWLPGEQLAHLDSTLLDRANLALLSQPLCEAQATGLSKRSAKVQFTQPRRLKADFDTYFRSVRKWLEVRDIPLTHPELQADVYLLGWTLTGILRVVRNDFYRDYLLDALDMMNDEIYASANYPRVSYGPGQRYGVKGCYIVRYPRGDLARPEVMAGWFIP